MKINKDSRTRSPVRKKSWPVGTTGSGAVLAQKSEIRTILNQPAAIANRVQMEQAQPMIYPKGCTITRAEVYPNRSWRYPWRVSISYTTNTAKDDYYEFYLVKNKECKNKTGKPSGYLLGGTTTGGVSGGSIEETATVGAVSKYHYAMMSNSANRSINACKKWKKSAGP